MSIFKKNKTFRMLCLIELLILTWIFFQCLRGPCNISFDTSNLNATEDLGLFVELVDNETEDYYTMRSEDVIDEVTVLSTNTFKLLPGSYNVTVRYNSETKGDEEDSYANSTGTLEFSSYNHGVYFSFNSLVLRDSYTEESQTVQINSPVALDDLKIYITYNGGGKLDIYSVMITEIVSYKYVLLALLLAVFLILDIIVIKFIDGVYGMAEGCLCLICFVAILPFLADFTFTGHDTAFHLNRIICLSDEIKMGNYFPSIYSTALNGYGYATPLFYGQLFIYIPAILYSCGFSLTVSYNAYIIIFSIATCLIMYYSSFEIFLNKKSAVLASALYTLSAVRLTNIFTRGAVGEFTAMSFLPLVVLGFYNVYSSKKDEKIKFKQYIPIVIGLTGIMRSHLLTIIMSAIVIILFCILSIKRTLQKNRMVALIKSLILTLILNFSYIVPLLESYSMDMIVRSRTNYIQSSGTYLLQLFNVIVNNFQEAINYNSAGNEMSLSLGFSITFGLIVYVYYLLKQRDSRVKAESCFKFANVSFIITICTIFMSTRLMPYDILDFLPNFVYSLLTSYQFPWRWLVFSTLFGVFCSTFAVASLNKIYSQSCENNVTLFISGLLVSILLINAGQIYADQLRTSEIQKYSNNSYDRSFDIGTGEYLILGDYVDPADLSPYYVANLQYDDSLLYVNEYMHNGGSINLYVNNYSASSNSILLPLICYDNYHAFDDNENELEISMGENARISIEIPAGYKGYITVEYIIPNRWVIARYVSGLSMFTLILYEIVYWIRSMKQRSIK